MTQSAELNALAVKVGEISGQLRELVHSQNNMSMKLDGLTERLLTSPTQADFQALSARVAALEAEKNRNDGAKGVFAAVLQSKAFGVIVTVLLSVGGAIVAIKEGVVILVLGMETGAFTGKGLRKYLSGEVGTYQQFREARRIINGMDKADLIAGHAEKFQAALLAGKWED